ncbi:MAG: polysaccharide deacetylase family protein [Opitutae bacterium]|nr:polysaccharide deacetylase family protein [Opitutae bacterium]
MRHVPSAVRRILPWIFGLGLISGPALAVDPRPANATAQSAQAAVVPVGILSEPGLLLTFDDRNLVNWEKQLPLFAKYGAHVTFFIDHFDALTAEQLGILRKLKKAGHAIGCHGLRHLKAVEYCEKNSVQKYLADEILPAIQRMEAAGFPPQAFAYPNSNHSGETDQALLKYFRHLRSGCRIEGAMDKTEGAFVKIADAGKAGRLDGLSFHPKTKTDNLVVQATKAIDRLKRNGELLVLYAHDIRNVNESGPKNFIAIEPLEEILAYAQRAGIKFYTYDELP